jgi:cytochrome P450
MPDQPPVLLSNIPGSRPPKAPVQFYEEELVRIQRMLDKAARGESAVNELGLQTMMFGLDVGDDISRLLAYLLDMVLDSDVVKNLMESFVPPAFDDVVFPPHLKSKVDPGSPLAISRPNELYAQLRRQFGDVVWVKAHGAYWVLSPKEVTKVLAAPGDFVQAPSSTTQRGIITLDRPRHTAVRNAVVSALQHSTPNLGKYIDDAVEAALQDIGELQQFDAVRKFSKPVPRNVFWNVLGVPMELRDECTAAAESMMSHFGQPLKRVGHRAAFTDALIRLAMNLAKVFVPALARSMIGADYGAGSLIGEIARRTKLRLSLDEARTIELFEALATLIQIVLASMSMQFHLGTALRNLLSPDPRPYLRTQALPWKQLADMSSNKHADFDLSLDNALLESRRVDPPVGIIQRYAGPSGAKIGNLSIPKDCPVFAVVASAHTSEALHPDEPQRFYWDRPPVDNLALGHGLHACVGRDLQHAVVPAALKQLMAVMPDLRLRDTDSVPAWQDNLYFRTLRSLPVCRCREAA